MSQEQEYSSDDYSEDSNDESIEIIGIMYGGAFK